MPARFNSGLRSRAQLVALDRSWRQGDHILITGGTGSGKTRLAREIDELRIKRGGYVVVFVCKLRPDDTLSDYYSERDGWVRWRKWKARPGPHENKILLWPDVEGKPQRDAVEVMRVVFRDALDAISVQGKWTVHIDEGLFMTSPSYLNFATELGLMYALMRSARATMITLAQRPSHLPLLVYANASQVFAARATEQGDLQRLANMGVGMSTKNIKTKLETLGRHEFLWFNIAKGSPPQIVDLAK